MCQYVPFFFVMPILYLLVLPCTIFVPPCTVLYSLVQWLSCTFLYCIGTRWYKVVQDCTYWYVLLLRFGLCQYILVCTKKPNLVSRLVQAVTYRYIQSCTGVQDTRWYLSIWSGFQMFSYTCPLASRPDCSQNSISALLHLQGVPTTVYCKSLPPDFCSTFVHWIWGKFKSSFKLVDILSSRMETPWMTSHSGYPDATRTLKMQSLHLSPLWWPNLASDLPVIPILNKFLYHHFAKLSLM